MPFFSWAVLCFLLLGLAYRFRLPFLAAAVGQVMLFRREAYQASGGHASVRSSIVDDLGLSRRVAALGLALARGHGSGPGHLPHVSQRGGCYRRFCQKPVCRLRLPPAALFVCLPLSGLLFWHPRILLVWQLLGGVPAPGAAELILCLGLALLVWLVPYLELAAPASLAYLYPLTILVVDIVAIKSLFICLRGRLTWKGRMIELTGWKWI